MDGYKAICLGFMPYDIDVYMMTGNTISLLLSASKAKLKFQFKFNSHPGLHCGRFIVGTSTRT